MLLVSSDNLLLIFIGLELAGLPLYALAAFDKSSGRSTEAALKIFLFGRSFGGVYALWNQPLLWSYRGSFPSGHRPEDRSESGRGAVGSGVDDTGGIRL